jgi:antitoxin component of MazEF toxin-antitoxin module
MTKTISKIGNSMGIIFDTALLELAHLKVGDQVNVEVHTGGTITITPLHLRPDPGESSRIIKSTMKNYSRIMKKLV